MHRLACALGGETMLPHILANFNTMWTHDDWEYRYAGLMMLKWTAEGTHNQMEAKLGELLYRIVELLKDPYPRVQYAACDCIALMAFDFAPTFQKKYQSKVIPGLLFILSDELNPKVQAHGCVALTNLVKYTPKNISIDNLNNIVRRLLDVLTKKINELVHYKKKLVLEQIVNTIATVADTVKEKFEPYYEE